MSELRSCARYDWAEEEEEMKEYFVFSDVHGEFDALQNNLIEMGFDIDDEEHVLFSLGDLFDKGPASHLVLEFLMDMWEKGRFIGIRGNHDDMLLEYIRDTGGRSINFNLIYNGLANTIIQLSDKYNSPIVLFENRQQITEEIIKEYPRIEEFLLDLKPMYEFGDFVFTHAGYSMEDDNTWFVDNWANTPEFIMNFDLDNKTYIFGHWNASKLYADVEKLKTPDDKVFIHKNFVGIDMKTNISKEVAVGYLFQNDDGVYEIIFHENRYFG